MPFRKSAWRREPAQILLCEVALMIPPKSVGGPQSRVRIGTERFHVQWAVSVTNRITYEQKLSNQRFPPSFPIHKGLVTCKWSNCGIHFAKMNRPAIIVFLRVMFNSNLVVMVRKCAQALLTRRVRGGITLKLLVTYSNCSETSSPKYRN